MPEITPFLKTLLSTSGISGYEAPVAKLIEEKWRPLVDEMWKDWLLTRPEKGQYGFSWIRDG